MTNKEMVIGVLNEYGAMTSKQISTCINRKFGVSVSPAQAAGTLRPLVGRSEAATSKDAYGKTVYWLTDYGKEVLIK